MTQQLPLVLGLALVVIFGRWVEAGRVAARSTPSAAVLAPPAALLFPTAPCSLLSALPNPRLCAPPPPPPPPLPPCSAMDIAAIQQDTPKKIDFDGELTTVAVSNMATACIGCGMCGSYIFS